MNFDLSDEQEMFRNSVERFCAPIDVEARRKLRLSTTGYDRARWEQLAEIGLIALAGPEEAGGLGGSAVDLALVAEALGKANSPDPWLELGLLPTLLLEKAGAHDALTSVAGGEQIIGLAWTERARRYNLKPSATKATTTSSGFALTGEKTLVLGALFADQFIVTAILENDEFGCFMVHKDAPGVEVRPYRLADGSIAGEIRLTNVQLDESAKLNVTLSGFEAVVSEMHLHASAEMVGLGQRLLDDTIAYAKEREQFGVAIGTFQALQHRLVECYARIEQCRSMLYRAALTDRADTAAWTRTAAGAKAFIAENVDAVAREAVQMHGGMGITDELAIGHAMKRVMVLSRMFGDVDTALGEYSEAA